MMEFIRILLIGIWGTCNIILLGMILGALIYHIYHARLQTLLIILLSLMGAVGIFWVVGLIINKIWGI